MQCRPPNYRGGSRVRSRSGCPLFFFALQFDGGYFAAAFTLDRIQDNMTHLGTYGQANGGFFARIAVDWLDWRLKGKTAAAAMFRGPKCGLCTGPGWHVAQAHLD